MDLDGNKQVCGTCKDWTGKRQWDDGKVQVKPSAKGQCERLRKAKPPHGGCDQWEKWEESEDGG